MAPSMEWLFATPLYWNKINDQRAVLKEFEGILPSLNFDYLEKWGKTHKLNENAFSTNLLDDMPLLADEVDLNVQQYLVEIGKRDEDSEPWGYEVESWVTKVEEGDYVHFHTHGNCDLSGVYYVKTRADECEISFQQPNSVMNQDWLLDNYNISWIHRAAMGKILLFPPWLSHGTPRAEGKDDFVRYSISFNFRFDAKYHRGWEQPV